MRSSRWSAPLVVASFVACAPTTERGTPVARPATSASASGGAPVTSDLPGDTVRPAPVRAFHRFAFSPDAARIAIEIAPGIVRFFASADGSAGAIRKVGAEVRALSFRASDGALAVVTDRGVVFFDDATGKETLRLESDDVGEPGRERVVVAPGGALVALVATQGGARLVESRGGNVVAFLDVAAGALPLRFDPGATRIAFALAPGGDPSRVEIWSVATRLRVPAGGESQGAWATSPPERNAEAGAWQAEVRPGSPALLVVKDEQGKPRWQRSLELESRIVPLP